MIASEIPLISAVERDLKSEGRCFISKAPMADEMDAIFRQLQEFAKLHLLEGGYSDVSISSNMRGYVEITHSGVKVYVPHTLARGFPMPQDLEKIIELSRLLSLQSPMRILVSGSGALSGDIPAIGDYDFCEYVERFNGNFVQSIQSSLYSDELKATLVPARVAWGQKKCQFPFSDIHQIVDEAKTSFRTSNLAAQDHWMLDYVGHGPDDSVTPISLRAIPVDFSSFEATATGKSWAFQEALITEGAEPPRELTSFTALGAYVNWLLDEAEKYIKKENNVLKSAKRSYSLANALFMYPKKREIAKALQDSELMSLVKRSSLQECLQTLNDIEGPICEELKVKAEQQLGEIAAANEEGMKRASEFCEGVVLSFLNEVEAAKNVIREEYI